MSSIAGLTDRGTVAAYLIVNTTRLSDRNYTTSRDVTSVGNASSFCRTIRCSGWAQARGSLTTFTARLGSALLRLAETAGDYDFHPPRP